MALKLYSIFHVNLLYSSIPESDRGEVIKWCLWPLLELALRQRVPIAIESPAVTLELIAQLDWFSIGHALREHNQEADRLANEAMDRGTGRLARASTPAKALPQGLPPQEFEGIVRDGKIELVNGTLADGTRVQIRLKR